MGKAGLPLAVPKLTLYEVKLAELCALDLWDGIDYQSGKELKVRDEVFLANFDTPAASLSSGRKKYLNVSVQDFHTFAIVAGLKSQYQTSNGTDLAKGITTFDSTVIPLYKSWNNKATVIFMRILKWRIFSSVNRRFINF